MLLRQKLLGSGIDLCMLCNHQTNWPETMYSAETHAIRVVVEPTYLEHESDRETDRNFWAYRVTITNGGHDLVQLLARYWHITDGEGRVEEVQGAGVVGEMPVIQPGDSFQYTSGCPLFASSGIMKGSYQMKAANGELLEVEIPAFSLDLPGRQTTLN